MSKKFPDLKTDEEADDWLQSADLTEYDLSEMKKVRFELAPKDASISLRLPAALLADAAGARRQGQYADAAVHPDFDRGAIEPGPREIETQAGRPLRATTRAP